MENKSPSRILVGVTGASGSIYASRLIECLLPVADRIYVIVTKSGREVVQHELHVTDRAILTRIIAKDLSKEETEKIRIFDEENLFAPIASGSSAPTAMVVLPCSMGSLARIANGSSTNLLERSADVVLKQRRKLLICPRETPLNLIHLRNLTTLAEAGAEIIPLMPAFYQMPKTLDDLVDFCVGRVMEQLGIEHNLYRAWNSRLI